MGGRAGESGRTGKSWKLQIESCDFSHDSIQATHVSPCKQKTLLGQRVVELSNCLHRTSIVFTTISAFAARDCDSCGHRQCHTLSTRVTLSRCVHEQKWLVRACCVATFTAAGLNECALACWQPNDPTLEVTCLVEYRSNGSGAVLRGCARPREQSLCLAQGFNDCTSRYKKKTPTHVQPITSVQRSCGPRSSDLLTAVLAFTDTPSLLALLCAGGVLCSQPLAATQRRGIRRSAGECSM